MTMIGIKTGFQTVAQEFQTLGTAQQAYVAIEAARKSAKALPNDQAGSVIAGQYADAWTTPLQYKVEEGTYLIVSAGPGQEFDTDDDIEYFGRMRIRQTTNMVRPVTRVRKQTGLLHRQDARTPRD